SPLSRRQPLSISPASHPVSPPHPKASGTNAAKTFSRFKFKLSGTHPEEHRSQSLE
ncbi:unnamed protein product, partial [Lampetra planeri]